MYPIKEILAFVMFMERVTNVWKFPAKDLTAVSL